MAEIFEELGEIIDEAESGITEEGEEAEEAGISEEELEEVEAEVAEARESVSTLRSVVDTLKSLDIPQVLKDFTIFVGKNAAIGAIFFGVTVLLKKLTAGSGSRTDKQAAQQKLKKTNALSTIIADISKISKTLTEWLKEHQNDEINVGSGITVPLPDIFLKYTKKMEAVSCAV